MPMSETALALGLALGIPAVLGLVAVLAFAYRRELVLWMDRRLIYNTESREGLGFLRGNFAPVDEEVFRGPLHVEGALPSGLRGVFMRNGPNPHFKPLGGYHWFDGDGMVHSVRIKDSGTVFYANNWVRTARLEQELSHGQPLFWKIGEMSGPKGLLCLLSYNLKRAFGMLSVSDGLGQANTSLVYHAKQVMALHEGDLPYVLRVLCNGVAETIGRLKISRRQQEQQQPQQDKQSKGSAPLEHFTAHPKVDPETGDMHYFGYNLEHTPHLQYGVMDSKGEEIKRIEIELPCGPVMMHDMALTRKYAVFLYMPLFFRPQEMVQPGGSGFPFVFDEEAPSKFGLLPRDAEDGSEIVWYDLPAGMIFHVCNAWDEKSSEGDGDVVHLYACSTTEYDLDLVASASSKYNISDSFVVGLKPADIAAAGAAGAGKTSNNKSRSRSGKFIPGAHGGMALMGGKADSNGDVKISINKSTKIGANFGISSRNFSRSKSRDGNLSRSVSSRPRFLEYRGDGEDTDAFSLVHFQFHTDTGLAQQQTVFDHRNYNSYLVEFPSINSAFLTKPNRFIYLATFCDGMKTNGIIKVDLRKYWADGSSPVAARVMFPDKHFGGEAVFVPAAESPDGPAKAEEDDGYVMTLVYNAVKATSYFMVYDAKTLKELAKVDLQVRVPYGFHGTFLSEEKLQAQLKEFAANSLSP